MVADNKRPAANDGGPAYTLSKAELEELVGRAVAKALATGSRGPLLVDKQDLARMIGCSPCHVDNLRKKGLPTVHVGQAVRFEPLKVVDWLREHGATSA